MISLGVYINKLNMPAKEPTNSAIMEKLGKLEGTLNARMNSADLRSDAILEQVKYTNGRVTKLERWKEKLDVIADYKKENGDGTKTPVVDWQKLMLYALGLVATALAIISFLIGKK